MAYAWTCEVSVEARDDGEGGVLLRQFDRHRSTKAVLTGSKPKQEKARPAVALLLLLLESCAILRRVTLDRSPDGAHGSLAGCGAVRLGALAPEGENSGHDRWSNE